ncbi:hypothetical protein MP228_004029 [Amoeboaphelidium protococcarum]|nr:hypothetical protein MP228_004029 [Amoeboaphelidium protococcarum]
MNAVPTISNRWTRSNVAMTALYSIVVAAIFIIMNAIALQTFQPVRYRGSSLLDVIAEQFQDEDYKYRLLSSAPALVVIVYLVQRHATKRWMQQMLLASAVLMGLKSLQIMTGHQNFTLTGWLQRNGNSSSSLYSPPTLNDIRPIPGLAALWAYALMQLDLLLATTSIFLVLLIHLLLQMTVY